MKQQLIPMVVAPARIDRCIAIMRTRSLLLAAALVLPQGITAQDVPAAPAGRVYALPADGAATLRAGEISPDGTRYAWEAGYPDSTGAIRILDLETGTVRDLARGRGRRTEPVWSPDGSRIAFWQAGSELRRETDGIWVLDTRADSAARIFGPLRDYGFAHSPRWVGPDSILFRNFTGNMSGGDDLWIVAADGSGARRVEDATRFVDRSPAGDRRAFFTACCDVAWPGVWVDEVGREERCIAGPLGYRSHLRWARDGRRVFFTERPTRDSPLVLRVADVGSSGAATVRRPDGSIVAMSASPTGMLAVHMKPEDDRDGTRSFVWVVPDDEVSPTVRDVSGCPSQHPVAARWARDQGIAGKLQIHEELRLDDFDFRAFVVRYDDGSRLRPAVLVRGHGGWIGSACGIDPMFGETVCPARPTAGATFRVRPDEEVLWSARFFDALAANGRWDRRWVDILLADSTLSMRVIEALLDLATHDDQVVHHPRVAERTDLLVRIHARGPDSPAGRHAFQELWRQAPMLIRADALPRDLFDRMSRTVARTEGSDSLAGPVAAALLEHPQAGGDPAILANLARLMSDPHRGIAREAGLRLVTDTSADAIHLRRAAPAIAFDSALAAALFEDTRIVDDVPTMLRLARTTWQEWRVAERARSLLYARWEREARAAAEAMEAAREAVRSGRRPIAIADVWSEAGPVGEDWNIAWEVNYLPQLQLIDPVLARTMRTRSSRESQEDSLCEAARTVNDPAVLALMAEGAVYATSTRLADCILQNPAAGEHDDVLLHLATMIDVNHEPELLRPDAPSIEDIRRRAAALRAARQ